MVDKPEHWPFAFRMPYEKERSYTYSINYSSETSDRLLERIGSPDDESQVERHGVKEILRLSEYLALEIAVSKSAKEIYLSSLSTDLAYNYSIADLTAAAIYAACKDSNCTRSASEVFGGSIMANHIYLPARTRLDRPIKEQIGANGNAIYAPPPKAGSPIRNIHSKMAMMDTIGISFSSYTEEDFLERYSSLLNLESRFKDAAVVCIEKYEEQFNSRSPSSRCAISLWYIADHLNAGIKLREITLATGYI